MAKKVKVKVDLKGLKKIGSKLMNKRTALEISRVVGGEIVSFISRGQSPVNGKGRFEPYVAQREANKENDKKKESARIGGTLTPSRLKAIQARGRKIAKNKSKYPNMHKGDGKRLRPVNLKLFGGLHKFILSPRKFMKLDKKTATVTLGFDKAPKKLQQIAEAHNDGTLIKQNVPQRQFIPNKKGDRFRAAIERKIRAVIERRVRKIK